MMFSHISLGESHLYASHITQRPLAVRRKRGLGSEEERAVSERGSLSVSAM